MLAAAVDTDADADAEAPSLRSCRSSSAEELMPDSPAAGEAAGGGNAEPSEFCRALLAARSPSGANLLLAAAGAGVDALVRVLLAAKLPEGYELERTSPWGQTALHLAAAGHHREACATLLEKTPLRVIGVNWEDAHGKEPLDVCSKEFAAALEELAAAIDEASGGGGGCGSVPREVLRRRGKMKVMGERYHVVREVTPRLWLADDVETHATVALKLVESRQVAEREANIMRLIGPETAPQVLGVFYDEKTGKHVLAMQAADSHGELTTVCRRNARKSGHELMNKGHAQARARPALPRAPAPAAAPAPPRASPTPAPAPARTSAPDPTPHAAAAAPLEQGLVRCVAACHDHGLVHCDLKPKHFMLFKGEWRLVDYDAVTEEGTSLIPSCTVRFASPEVASARAANKPLHISAAADVWALGLVLFELFTGAVRRAEDPSLTPHPLCSAAARTPGLDPPPPPPLRARAAQPLFANEEVDEHTLVRSPELAMAKLAASDLDAAQRNLLQPMLAVQPGERATLRATLKRRFFLAAEDTESSKHIELLALFSSPAKRKDGSALPPLQLMKEIISLQESIPRKLREIRPAAQFPADIEHALKEHSPRVLQFSGHGNAVKRGPFAGALAFELADGTLAPADPIDFIALLDRSRCPRLECVTPASHL